MSRTLELPAVLAVVGALATFPCSAGDARVADPSARVRMSVSTPDATGKLQAGFVYQGRDFRLQLAPNPRLARWTAGSRWQQYTGSLEGVTASWVRLAVADGALRGVIFDGHELLLVEPRDGSAAQIVRVADVPLARQISFADDSLRAPPDALGRSGPLAAALVAGQTADRKLEISAIADATFRARYASEADARDAVVTRLNIVDGIFSAQVGAGVEVTSINVADSLSDSLDVSTDPPILLDSLGRLRQQTPALHERGLTHLFTGRNLDADSVGIAYSGTLCNQRYSASLAQAHDSATIDGLISAHEIGHVFGAPHDGDGQCADTSSTEFIMAPILNPRATSFSQCSLEQMAPRVANATCLEVLAPPDMALPASLGEQDVAVGANSSWTIDVQNRGERSATGARVTVEMKPALEMISATASPGSCVVQASLATCDLPAVNGGESLQMKFSMRSASAGTFSAHAQVVTPDDSNRSNDTSAGSLLVQAAASPPAPQPSSGGSGGGAMDRGSLAILAALLAAVARRRWRLDPGVSPRAADARFGAR